MRLSFSTLLFAVLLCVMSLPASAAPTTTTLSVTQNGNAVTAISSGSVVTLTATVKAGSALVSPGTVNFCDAAATYCTDVHILGTAQLTSAGVATVKFFPPPGDHLYSAQFAGTHLYEGSTSAPYSLAVKGLTPSFTTLTESGVGSDYTLTATVAGFDGLAPIGNVSFLDADSALLGSGFLGSATTGFTFLSTANLAVSPGTTAMATGDFNGDGRPDIIVALGNGDSLADSFSVLLGNGDGAFTAAPPSVKNAPDALQVAVGDFNEDGKADLVMVSPSAVSVLLGKGDGTFPTAISLTYLIPSYAYPGSPAVADVSGDGHQDIVLGATSLFFEGQGGTTVLLGNGDGTFNLAGYSPQLPINYYPQDIKIGDFNGDGKPDLAIDGGSVEVMLGNGDGTFGVPFVVSGSFGSSRPVSIADFNQDGRADLIIGGDSNSVQLMLGNADGTFTPGWSLTTSSSIDGAAVADFNGDGKADLALMQYNPSGQLTILLGKDDGTFSAGPVLIPPGTAPGDLGIADFNSDGKADLAFTSQNAAGNVSVYLAENGTATVTVTDIVAPPTESKGTVHASYPGDANYAPSQSPTIALTPFTETISPRSLDFGAIYLGDNSAYQQVTLTNTGSAALAISSIASTQAFFGVREQTCGQTLAASASCTFKVVFAPREPGSFGAISGNIVVSDNAPGGPQTVAVTGTIKAGKLTVIIPSLEFDPTSVGSTAAYEYVTLYNVGNAALNIDSIGIGYTTDFYSWGIREQTCGPVLAAGSSCTFAIAFRPTRTGDITAKVDIVDHGPGAGSGIQQVTLTGTGK